MTSIEDPRPRQQVFWEVEVEDEVLARLGGVWVVSGWVVSKISMFVLWGL
jgi:hypothetical protein